MDASFASKSMPVLPRLLEKTLEARISSSPLKLLEIDNRPRRVAAFSNGVLSLWILRHT